MTVVNLSELDTYTDAEFASAFERTLKSLITPDAICTHTNPRAVLLGGQSGAGKTTLHKIFSFQFDGDVVIVNGDAFRASHPNFAQLNAAYGKDAVSHTAAWSGKMTETLIDALSKLGYNLIIEGTLRTSSVPKKTAELLRSRGYDVSLALMAVKPELSLVSCQLRYEEMRLAGTTPRATDPEHHRKIVDDIVGNLKTLETSGLFSEVYLYTRSEECLYPREGEGRSASEVLQDTLFGAWSDTEKAHLAFLEQRLEELKQR